MTPNEYQKLAERTECDQENSHDRMSVYSGEGLVPIRLNHSIIGLAGEVGELAAELQRWVYYGKGLNVTNIIEEFGDCLWYIAEGLNALGIPMEEVMTLNIAKLKQRYPEKYTDYHAAQENRDLKAEQEILKNFIPISE